MAFAVLFGISENEQMFVLARPCFSIDKSSKPSKRGVSDLVPGV